MLTLLWGLPGDGPLALVRDELDRLGVPSVFLDQHDVLDMRVELDANGSSSGRIHIDGRSLDLDDVSAAYVRPHDTLRIRSVAKHGIGSEAWRHATDVDDAIVTWAEMTDAFVVNRPSAMAGNSSKPWQLRRIAMLGFGVPDTVVTTDPDVARDFWHQHREVVYKSVSGVRSTVARLAEHDIERLRDLVTCPTLLQRFVAGTDVRVHVVGVRAFATEISCDADDYRYATQQGWPQAELTSLELPPEIEERCRRLAAALGLVVAGIDLRLGLDGTWYCFEVNPSPAFNYYERGTSQPIARAVACLLAAAGPVRDHRRRLRSVVPT